MSKEMWFWLIYVICLLFSTWSIWPQCRDTPRPFGIHFAIFVLMGLLGWAVFGSPIK